MKKKIVNERLWAIRVLIVVLAVVSGVAPAWAHGTHYAGVSVTASPSGQGKVYMTTDGDYVPEDGDWQNSMSGTWNCGDGVKDKEDSRTYYVHAQAESGYHFEKWSSSSDGTDSKSTAAKYAYSTSAQSESSGSPTANNIYAIFAINSTYTATFLTTENGTFKYQYGSSGEVRVESQHSVTTNQNFTFTALPEAGYTLYGWYTKSGETKTYFDYTSTTISSYALPGNISIGVDFVPVGTPIFQIKGANKTYTDLNAAITACGSATRTIVLINNGTLPAGNYTIPANVTLLIPFDAGFTYYTTTPALTSNSFLTPEVYRTLTMAPGATLTVNGAISVSAKLSSRSGYGPNGATSGKYGAIKMLTEGNTKSKITLNNGAKLYGWGYIYGEGAIEALSGSAVYEGFVIMDWRGGNNTLDMYNNKDKYKVFPFNQYYIQNIEVPLTIHKGATETVYSSVYGNGSDNPLSITMVGASEGLFRLTGTGAKLTKWYDPFYDRQHYELEGAAAINAISFTAFGMTVSSSAFVLPITNNMDITVRQGATVSIAEDICIMPDASVTVEQGATMNIASDKNVYVYDIQAYTNAGTYTTNRSGYPSAGPGRYAAGAYVRHISYSPSWAALSDREIRRVQNMSSAHFQVNGTLNVNGYLYTTEGGADIFSTADGAAVNLVSGAGTANKTYQVDHEDYDAYYYTIPITSAQLHHADGTYQATAGNAANTIWTYAHGHWGWRIIWREEDGTELKRMYQLAQPNATWISSNAPATGRAAEGTCSFVFNGWNTVTNTSQQEIILTADYTKTCAEYYDVLWKSEDGTETYETDENVGKGETTRYNGAAPVKADDEANGFTYTFDGWTTEPNGGGTKYNIGETPAATGDATYYAHFTTTEVAAIITANGVVSYYPSIADAFTAANASDYTPTIQVWRDAPNTPALTYTAKNHCTLDLNGHTVSGTEMPLLTINDEGFTFTVTDRTETKEGKLAGTSGVSQAFVVSLVSGVFRLEAGTVYGQNIGTGVMAGVYAGANREVIMTGGTIQVDANSGTGYGIFAQGKATVNGGTFRVESSAKAAYAVQAQGSNGNVTVTDGKFYAAGKTTVTCVLANGSASMTVNGGYYNINTNLATYLGADRHIFNLPSSELPYQYKVGTGGYTVTFQNTDGTVLQSGMWESGATPEYTGDAPTKPGDTGGEFIHSSWTPELAPITGDATYTATYVPTPPVASVTISGTTTNYIHFSDAWTAANTAATAASTLKLLDDVDLTTGLEYTNASKNCTLDLNGHIISGSATPLLEIAQNGITFTITDLSEEKEGRIECNTNVSGSKWAVEVTKSTLRFEEGTIYAKNTHAGDLFIGIYSGASGVIEISGGNIHTVTTAANPVYGVLTFGTATISGGSFKAESSAAGYAVEARNSKSNVTITGGKFSASGTSAACVYKSSGSLTLKGGCYDSNTNLAANCAANYHVFPNSDASYPHKVAEAYNLTWTTDGELSGEGYTPAGLTEVGTPIVAPTPTKAGYTFYGWTPAVAAAMPSADTEYTAQWAVASVTINDAATLFTDFNTAWTAVNSATAASTLTLWQDVTVTTQLAYTNSYNQNCTFDLNGHILTSNTSVQGPLHINNTNITFTVTDGTEEKAGKLSLNSSSSSAIFGAFVDNGTLLLNAGTIEVTSSTATTCGVTANSNGTFTMNAGTIHVKTTNSKEGRGVYSVGTATVNGGTILVEAGGVGYGIKREGGTATVVDGKFNISGSTANVTTQTSATANMVIRGGYYTTKSKLYPTAPYHVFDLTSGAEFDEGYRYKVAEGYTVTFKNSDETLQSGLWEKGATPLYSGETPAKAADAQYTYTFNGWNVPIAPVTANVIYTAQFSSTVNTYTMTWKNDDGTTLETDENVPYGNTPVYNGATPTKAKDAEYAYTFNGWSPTVSAVTGDATYTATYTTTPVVASVTVNASGKTFYYTDFSTAFAEANGATFAVTITLLKDVSSAALVYNGSNTDCTLDLNGHTLTGTSTAQLILNINKVGSTFTITDKSESKSGQMRIEATNTSEAYGVYVSHGHLKLEAGTIYASLVATTCAGVRAVNANSSFTMDGGTIHVVTTNAKNGIGVTASNGTTTINDGTILVEAAKDGYGINRTGGTVTINNGKFNISASGSAYATNQASANASVVIRGGYYTTNSWLNPTAPYHVFGLDNQSPYLYEVAEGYTLTWTTDGDPLAGTYTSGVTKPGATIVEPATPTKTGYTFNVWNPAVAAAMPAENTEYTATWTRDNYTISYALDGGTVASANPTAYNVETTTFTLNNPTKEGYTFLGWTGSNGFTPQTAVSIANGSTGDKNYTANWAVNVASVTVNSTTAYYTSFADAWTAANSATAASTLTLLQDISGLSSTRTYSASHDLMLNLNGHTLSGSGTSLFQIGCAENTFTVTDGSANHDGKLSFTTAESSTSSFHCVIVNNGTFVLEAGTIEATSSTVSIGAVQVVGGTFTMNENGAIHVRYTGNGSNKNSRMVHANGGTTIINGGTIRLESTKDAIGVVYSTGSVVTVNGGKFHITASGTAAVTNQNVAKDYLNIRGGYYSANTTGYFEPHVKTPYHRFSNSDATYIYRVAEAYTLTWDLDGGNVSVEGTPAGYVAVGEPITAPTVTKTGYTFTGWSTEVAQTMPANDVTYTATWEYNAVASVTINSATTYYTTLAAAWTAVNHATAASTLTLLQDVSITDYLHYNNSNNKNCMLDLNGHTLSSTTAMALLYINACITFTITDLTDSQSGTLHLESTSTANRWCVYVANGNLQMDAGTVFLHSKANQFNEGIRIDPAASTFTMNGGKVHVKTSDGQPACGIVSRGTAVIHGGEIQVEASGIGYGIEARVSGANIGNVTVNGGKFLVTGSTAACAYKSAAAATLALLGGYYNTNTSLEGYCADNYHVLPLTGAEPYQYVVVQNDLILTENGDNDYYDAFKSAYDGQTINVTYNRQFTSGRWSTMCLPFSLDLATMIANKMYGCVYEFKYATGNANVGSGVNLYFSNAKSIEAGKCYIVNANAELAAKTSFVFSGVTIDLTNDKVATLTSVGAYNDLPGYKSQGTIELVGTLRNGTLKGTATGNTYMGLKSNHIYYPNIEQGSTVYAYRGIFRSTETLNIEKMRIVVDGEDRGELIIDADWDVRAPSRKFIENGVLYIEREGVIYDAHGKRVEGM